MKISGVPDYSPSELRQINNFEDELYFIAKSNNFERLDPYPLMPINKLDRGGDNIIVQTNINKSKLGLPFDHTLPFIQWVNDHRRELKFPLKRVAFGNVFRGESPQLGRFNAFKQFDLDIVKKQDDETSLESVLDIIIVQNKMLAAIGIKDYKFHISSRTIWDCILKDFNAVEFKNILQILDKNLDSNTRRNLLSEYISNIDLMQLVERLSDFKGNIDELKLLMPDNSELYWGYLAYFFNKLEESKEIVPIVIDLSIVRGLEYYTRIVYEVFLIDGKLSIAGGGEYTITYFERSLDQFVSLQCAGGSIGLSRIMSVGKFDK